MIIENNNPYKNASFTFGNRLCRQIWNLTYVVLFRFSPRGLHIWRAFLLRLFGAKLGKGCHIYPAVKIWAPWNLRFGDYVGVGDGVTLYSMDKITIGSFAVISQGAHLCCGSHDYNSKNFQLFAKPITIGEHAWVCAEVFIHPGVSVANGVVIGARSVVGKHLATEWSVYAGNPCISIGKRRCD